MSLDWKIDKIEDYQTVCWHDGKLNPLTHKLIWETMVTGLDEITKDNLEEWLFRLAVTYRVYGSDGDKITREDLEQHIGLRTNASRMTHAKFMKRMSESLAREALRDVDKSKKEKAVTNG